jgi:hypothetical protein
LLWFWRVSQGVSFRNSKKSRLFSGCSSSTADEPEKKPAKKHGKFFFLLLLYAFSALN